MNRIIGMAWCRLVGKHVWGRAYEEPLPDGMGGTIHRKAKKCSRCGATRAVKQRKKT